MGCPYNMVITSKHIKENKYDYLIAKVLSKGLNDVIEPYKEVEKHKMFNLEKALNSTNVEDFDESLTIKLYGYPSVHDYYR